MKPLLVGEQNLYGADPALALYPLPRHSAGGRLCCVVLGLSRTEYLRRFDRANLLTGPWSVAKAGGAALGLIAEERWDRFVLCGVRVAAAFDVPTAPFRVHAIEEHDCWVATIPHPSGRCRVWNEPGAVERARRTVEAVCVPRVEDIRVGEIA